MNVKSLHVAALFILLCGTASASSLVIDMAGPTCTDTPVTLPMINGVEGVVPTFVGTAGEAISVCATITADTPLVLGNITMDEATQGGVGIDTSIYYDPSNTAFYNAEDPASTPLPVGATTGTLATITFPTAAAIYTVFYSLEYQENGSPFSGYFNVETVAPGVPEPAYTGLIAITLGLGAFYHRRRHRA